MLTKDQFMKLLNKRAITKPGAARSMARARRNVTIPGLLHALAEKEKQAAATGPAVRDIPDAVVDSESTATLQVTEPITLGPELDRELYVIDISEEATIDSGCTAVSVTVDLEASTDVAVDEPETTTTDETETAVTDDTTDDSTETSVTDDTTSDSTGASTSTKKRTRRPSSRKTKTADTVSDADSTELVGGQE